MQRVDLATTIHKAIRKLLFEQTMLLGRTDFAVESEVSHALIELERTISLLREHGEHEDTVVFPELAASEPELLAECERQHASLEHGFREIEALASALQAAAATQRQQAGAHLARRFQSFVAEQLEHMSFEETTVSAALWRLLDDQKLAAMRTAIRARVTPERGPIWAALVMSSANAAELRELGAPPPALPRSA